MARFTLPRDLYHGKGALEALKTFKGKKAMVCVGGGSMKRFGFLDRAVGYLKEAGFEVMNHIYVYVDKNEKIAEIIKKYADQLKAEVLADSITLGEMQGYTKEWNINGENVMLGVAKVTK